MIGNHLVAAATIMAIEQNDFRDLSTCNLPGTAQTHHVFDVAMFPFIIGQRVLFMDDIHG